MFPHLSHYTTRGAGPGAPRHVSHGIPPGFAAHHVLLEVTTQTGTIPCKANVPPTKSPTPPFPGNGATRESSPAEPQFAQRAQIILGKGVREQRGRNNCPDLGHLTTWPWGGMEVFLPAQSARHRPSEKIIWVFLSAAFTNTQRGKNITPSSLCLNWA